MTLDQRFYFTRESVLDNTVLSYGWAFCYDCALLNELGDGPCLYWPLPSQASCYYRCQHNEEQLLNTQGGLPNTHSHFQTLILLTQQ